MENPQINCKDKKTKGLRPLIYNPLYKIKIYRFSGQLYPKDLVSSTYIIFHVCDAVPPML